MTVEELLDLRTTEFTAYVRENVAAYVREVWNALLDPRLAYATRDALTAINMDVESQMGQRKAKLEAFQNECFSRPGGRQEYFNALAEHNTWKYQTMGFKRLLQRRIEEARVAAAKAAPHLTPRGQAPTSNPVKIQHNIRALFELAYAVLQHHEACLGAGVIPEPHDLALWEKLETIHSYSTQRGAMALNDWLEHVMSRPGWIPPGGHG